MGLGLQRWPPCWYLLVALFIARAAAQICDISLHDTPCGETLPNTFLAPARLRYINKMTRSLQLQLSTFWCCMRQGMQTSQSTIAAPSTAASTH